MRDDEKELVAEAELGDEAKRFMESDLYRFMIGAAEQDVSAALEGLEVVDANDAKAIIALQNKIWLGRTFKSWLDELVSRGDAALEVWRHNRTGG